MSLAWARRVGSDVVGGSLLAALTLWLLLIGAVRGGDPWPWLATLLAAGGGYALARVVRALGASAVPLLVIGAGAAVFALSGPGEVLSAAPRAGPFGYSSVTAAFFLPCALAGLILALSHKPVLAPLGVLAAIVSASVAVATDTRAVMVLFLGLGVGALLVRTRFGTRWAVALCGAAFGAGLGVSVILAAGYAPRGSEASLGRVADATLSERRLQLQHDGWTLMLEHPLAGVGLGRFAEESPAAGIDTDTTWAHHDFLQLGAEAGVPAFLLLTALFLWAFPRLGNSIHHRTATTFGAVAVASLGVHACVDFVLQHPPVSAMVGALVGSAVGRFGWVRRRGAAREGGGRRGPGRSG